jgi:hypothetical protein
MIKTLITTFFALVLVFLFVNIDNVMGVITGHIHHIDGGHTHEWKDGYNYYVHYHYVEHEHGSHPQHPHKWDSEKKLANHVKDLPWHETTDWNDVDDIHECAQPRPIVYREGQQASHRHDTYGLHAHYFQSEKIYYEKAEVDFKNLPARVLHRESGDSVHYDEFGNPVE